MKQVVFFAALFVAAASMAIAQPKIEIVGGDTHDWGKVKAKDSPLKAVIKLKNVGNEILKITDVHPGCGCTKTAELDKKELKPGEIATTEISLNLGTLSGDVTKSVSISSNDPVYNVKNLILKANVIRDINWTPSAYFAFPDMVVGKTATAKTYMQNNSNNDVIIQNTSAVNGASLNLKKGTVLKKGSKLEVIVSVTPKTKGYYSTSCRIETSHPEYPTMEIPAYGNVRNPGDPAPNAAQQSTPFPTPVLEGNSAAPKPNTIKQITPEPDLKVIPSSVFVFNDLKVGKKSTAQITMENTSKKIVKIESITNSNGLTLSIAKGTTFKPGEKKVVYGYFTPVSKGQINGVCQVRAENGAANLLLVGSGIAK